MVVFPILDPEALVQVAGEERGADDHKGVARGHDSGQHGGQHDAHQADGEQVPDGNAESQLGVFQARVEGDAADADESPGHRAEAFDERADAAADAAVEFGLGRASGLHALGLGNDAYQGVEHDHGDVEQGDCLVGRW